MVALAETAPLWSKDVRTLLYGVALTPIRGGTAMTGASDLLLETSDNGNTAAVIVHGSLESATADELRRRLRFLIDAGHPRLDLDLDDVWFLDGEGVGVLVGALKAQE